MWSQPSGYHWQYTNHQIREIIQQTVTINRLPLSICKSTIYGERDNKVCGHSQADTTGNIQITKSERLYNKRSQSIGYHCQYANQQAVSISNIQINKSQSQLHYIASGHSQAVSTANIQINKSQRAYTTSGDNHAVTTANIQINKSQRYYTTSGHNKSVTTVTMQINYRHREFILQVVTAKRLPLQILTNQQNTEKQNNNLRLIRLPLLIHHHAPPVATHQIILKQNSNTSQ